jgi:hypothetical protein
VPLQYKRVASNQGKRHKARSIRTSTNNPLRPHQTKWRYRPKISIKVCRTYNPQSAHTHHPHHRMDTRVSERGSGGTTGCGLGAPQAVSPYQRRVPRALLYPCIYPITHKSEGRSHGATSSLRPSPLQFLILCVLCASVVKTVTRNSLDTPYSFLYNNMRLCKWAVSKIVRT